MKPVTIEGSAIQEILEISGDGDISHLKELIKIYAEDNKIRIDKMEQYFASKDPKSLSKEAHALRSSSSALGARDLEKICFDIEYMHPEQIHTKQVKELVDALRPCFEQTCLALTNAYLYALKTAG